jgi:hypothetical protein
MLKSEFYGATFEVNEKATEELYRCGIDWCQCEGCTTARIARKDSTPPFQAQFLASLGLDPHTPYMNSWVPGRRRKEVPGFGRRNLCWIACGKLAVLRTDVLRVDRYNTMWLSSDVEDLAKSVQGWSPDKKYEKDLIYIFASNLVPLLYNEVASYRTDYVTDQCNACRSRWRETGYLKRHSRIPEWKQNEEMRVANRDRKKRVYVLFCSQCGEMEFRIVDRKKPFRVKNTLYEDERKHFRKVVALRERSNASSR